MLSPTKVIKTFSKLGAEILADEKVFVKKFKKSRGILLDWDGVFNRGEKGENGTTTFSEIDSVGLNLLRYALWEQLKEMPGAFIISGVKNVTALQFAQRESFNAVYLNFKNKSEALQHIQDNYKISPAEMICIFDDVLDLSMVKDCGLRFLVSRKSNPLFMDYVKSKKYCDYVTANPSGQNPIREVCEFLLGISGNYEKTIDSRVKFSENYGQYWKERNAVTLSKFEGNKG